MIDYNRRVQVFYNLHKRCFSVRQDGVVQLHTDILDLYDARFLVQPAGREKVLREKRKNVHAFVTGYIVEPSMGEQLPVAVTYNPYKYSTFVQVYDETPVHSAARVALRNNVKPTIHIV